MWAASYLPPQPQYHPLIPKLTKPPPVSPPVLSVSARSQPPGQDHGGLGKSILTKLKSNRKPSNPILPKQGNIKKQDEEGKQMFSGSDVLVAMQRAAAAKKQKENITKKKMKGKGSISYAGSHREEEGVVDYGEVRPLCVKSDWGGRLDMLEERLHELSSKGHLIIQCDTLI